MSDKAVDDRIAEGRQREARRNAALAELGFGPVVRIQDASGFGAFLGTKHEHVTCQTCGSMVALGDHIEDEINGEVVQVEKNIRLHLAYHRG